MCVKCFCKDVILLQVLYIILVSIFAFVSVFERLWCSICTCFFKTRKTLAGFSAFLPGSAVNQTITHSMLQLEWIYKDLCFWGIRYFSISQSVHIGCSLNPLWFALQLHLHYKAHWKIFVNTSLSDTFLGKDLLFFLCSHFLGKNKHLFYFLTITIEIKK